MTSYRLRHRRTFRSLYVSDILSSSEICLEIFRLKMISISHETRKSETHVASVYQYSIPRLRQKMCTHLSMVFLTFVFCPYWRNFGDRTASKWQVTARTHSAQQFWHIARLNVFIGRNKIVIHTALFWNKILSIRTRIVRRHNVFIGWAQRYDSNTAGDVQFEVDWCGQRRNQSKIGK